MPQWWKIPQNHYLLARYIIPSRDEQGQSFSVDVIEEAKRIKQFNDHTRGTETAELWRD